MEAEPPDPVGLSFFSVMLVAAPAPDISLALAFLLVLLFFSGLISGSEVAFFSLNPNQIANLKSEDSPSAKRILRLKDKPRTLLATILIANNLINIAIVVLSDYILWQTLPETTFRGWSEGVVGLFPTLAEQVDSITRLFNFLVTVAGVTFVLVVIGEVTPKLYATVNNLKLSRTMSAPLSGLMDLFWPFSKMLVKWSSALERRIAKRRIIYNPETRKEELDLAIDLTVSGDADSEKEVDILKSIVKFGDVSVRQIMSPRVNVVALDFNSKLDKVFKTVRESGYSRLPVYQDDLDNLMGILYVKDLLGLLEKDNHKNDWQELIRTDILYVPENKKINELLKEFQLKRMHMGIVVDEYGGCSGIVTLEDIMEEVIGEIRDEFDSDEELEFIKIDNRNFIFEGKTQLNDVCRIMSIDTNTFDNLRGESDTIAGLILETLGKLPKPEQEITLGGFKFKVLLVNKRRIEKVKVTITY